MNTKYTVAISAVIVLAIAGIVYAAGRMSQTDPQVESSLPGTQQPAGTADNPSNPAPTPAEPAPTQPTAGRIPNGAWGGDHINMAVATNSITVEFDCAHGTINQPVNVDSKGQFSASGTYTHEHGGPVRSDEKPEAHPATYAGTVIGNSMTVTITLTDTKEKIGTFKLTKGVQGRIFKCL